MDALNTIDSDRVNDIAQHIQNILWGDNVATLINVGIDPLRAIEIVGLFTDPQQVALDSAERIDEILFNQKTKKNSDKKMQPDITDQPSKVSVSDE